MLPLWNYENLMVFIFLSMTKKKLFILEDDVITAEMYAHFFSEYYNVAVANNVQSFRDYFKNQTPDAAIIDINIRDSHYDGAFLVKELKDLRLNRTKFIAVTGYQDLKSAELFDGHFKKPIDLDHLNHYIQDQINQESVDSH